MRPLLFNWEKALCDGAYLVIMGLSMVYSSPQDFHVLVVISAGAVVTATALAFRAGMASPGSVGPAHLL